LAAQGLDGAGLAESVGGASSFHTLATNGWLETL
jgi:hypothetical protein